MLTIAILILVFNITNILTPGSVYKNKPEVDWESPKLNLSVANFCLVMALVLMSIFQGLI